jgi:DNA-binding transcriptional ArsR family regulator
MKGQPSFYTITRAEVRYDKRIPGNAKLLYGEIVALSRKEGCCWASNRRFAELYGVSRSTVTNWVRALKDAGYITVELQYGAKGNVERRRLFIAEGRGERLEAERVPAEGGGQLPERGAVNSLAKGGQISEQGGQFIEGGGQFGDGGWSNISEKNSTSDNITSTRARGAGASPQKEDIRVGEERAEEGKAGAKPGAKPGLERSGEEGREKVKARWVENYREVCGEAPIDGGQRRLDKHIDRLIGKIGVERILLGLDRAKEEEFCLDRGYLLKIILSENVLSRLLRAPGAARSARGQDDYVDFFKKHCGLEAA